MKNEISKMKKINDKMTSLILKLFPEIRKKVQYYDLKISFYDPNSNENDILIDNFDEIKKTYSYLADNKSKKVFSGVIKAHLYHSITKKVQTYDEIKEKCEWINKDSTKTLDNGEIIYVCHDDRQYDPRDLSDVIKYSENETFLDIGAFDGCTIWQFHKLFKGKYKNIISFEPSKFNYNSILNMIKDIHDEKIIVHNYGLAKKECVKYFPKCLNPACKGYDEDKNGNLERCEFKNIYSLLSKDQIESVSVIKIDVEGQELDVLESLESIIVKNKPKLIISVYHKPEDIYLLPNYIKKLLPNHKFYLRHHSNWRFETVLYVID